MPICPPTLTGPHANVSAWDADKPAEMIRCQGCKAVYPGRLMAKVQDGICETCRGGDHANHS